MNYSRWLNDFKQLEKNLEDGQGTENKETTPKKEDEKQKAKGKCLACWFEPCRCREGLKNKKI